ncbi:hypothetical protein CEP54_003518 [Fusarium duplospermum]|uniref:OTU domain-containing protein n=1 Tax=Fusarium duplospermum TaxID=1325734 RepID=A0A428QNT7_9HYPO|nr:hypothetical protein CEP54_003518 [Fusarium duplospermum]
MDATETLEQIQARHRRELKDLQGRITGKKKNATKKTRKGVNDECAEMERNLREKHAAELLALEPAKPDEELEEITVIENKPEEEKLVAETAKLKVSVPAQQQQQQPGKKRNRQKERMARRAAEQEEAAQRAEEEAANMTDHRAKESEFMKTTFEKHGLVEQDIAPDGHCLFSAVADQLGQHDIPLGVGDGEKEPAYKTVRRAATAYMLEHGDDFAPFLEEDLGDYARKMRDTAEWGGQLELMALARQYKAEIRVVQDGRLERIGEDEGAASGKTLWLAYYRHGYGLGEHYNSLRKAP